ncbi:Amino acid transporter [Aphelenchoides fujianensis]|nr:Amino acid transporter [Aphelenchoides fujianensis]
MDFKSAGRMGGSTLAYYFVTTTCAIITGIVLVLMIHPGRFFSEAHGSGQQVDERSKVRPMDTFLDVVRNMIPENVVQAAFQRTKTEYRPIEAAEANGTLEKELMEAELIFVDGINLLGVIVFCTALGITLSHLGERARVVVEIFVILEAAIMKLIEFIMWIAPVGITSLIAGNLLELEDIQRSLTSLGFYLLTIFAALGVHTFFTMPVVYFAVTRKNPLVIVAGMKQSLIVTFGTASGGAALPVSMHCMEDVLQVDRRVSRFVLSLGSSANMDGNALYEAIAVIFIAQLHGVQLALSEVVTISLIATLASLGLNSVPAGLVSILMILTSVDLPTSDIPLLFTVDWLIDRVRTTINVLGDAFVTSAVAHLLRDELRTLDAANEFGREIRAEIGSNLDFLPFVHQMLEASRPSSPKAERDAEILLPFGSLESSQTISV